MTKKEEVCSDILTREGMSEANIVGIIGRSIEKITIVIVYKEIIEGRDFFIFQVLDMV